MRYAPSTLEAYRHEYMDYLFTLWFGAISSNGDVEIVFDTPRDLIATQCWLREHAGVVTEADAAQSCEATPFHMSTCSLYAVKNNTVMLCG